jgi:hypothetical protein
MLANGAVLSVGFLLLSSPARALRQAVIALTLVILRRALAVVCGLDRPDVLAPRTLNDRRRRPTKWRKIDERSQIQGRPDGRPYSVAPRHDLFEPRLQGASLLPREGGQHLYRIKTVAEAFERIAKESELVRGASAK